MKNIQSRRDKPGTHDLRLEEAGNQHPSGSFSLCHPFLVEGAANFVRLKCEARVVLLPHAMTARSTDCTLLWYVLYALVRRTTSAAHLNVSQASHHFFWLARSGDHSHLHRMICFMAVTMAVHKSHSMSKSMDTVQSAAAYKEKASSCKPTMLDRESALPASPLITMEQASDAPEPRTSCGNVVENGSVPEITTAICHNPGKHGMRRRRINWRAMSGSLLLLIMLLVRNPTAEAQVTEPSLPTEPVPTASQPNGTPQPSGSSPSTSQPSVSTKTTLSPTVSPPTTNNQSSLPTQSLVPTTQPTSQPTSTLQPTELPSVNPTEFPSVLPSHNPTAEPTFEKPSWAIGFFRQRFIVGNGRIFSEEEVASFQEQFENYTVNFGPQTAVDGGRINTTCTVTGQLGLFRRNLGLGNTRGRSLQGQFTFNEVDFSMSFQSLHTNVSTYPVLFQTYINQNRDIVALDLQRLGLDVMEIERASRSGLTTPAPTTTGTPTETPTGAPTTTRIPSFVPSDFPSLAPSMQTNSPTHPPTPSPGQVSEPSGSSGGSPTEGGNAESTAVVVSIGVALAILLIGLLVYYRRRKMLEEMAFQTNAVHGSRKPDRPGVQVDEGSWGAAVRKPSGYDNSGPSGPAFHPGSAYNGQYAGKVQHLPSPIGMGSPSESLVSGQSLLSAGNSMGGDSADEADATQNLADEFDQYKDQNLERMRADVEGSLTGFDGMMSQALTKVLIDDEEAPVEPTSAIFWGAPTLSGCEIEASALGEVTDWLKRKENASIEERLVYYYEDALRFDIFSFCILILVSLTAFFFSKQACIHARYTKQNGGECALWRVGTR